MPRRSSASRSRSRDRIADLENRVDEVSVRVDATDDTVSRMVESLQRQAGSLAHRVRTLERLLETLQHFSMQHSDRLATLEARAGVPTPPAGPPPATPSIRSIPLALARGSVGDEFRRGGVDGEEP